MAGESLPSLMTAASLRVSEDEEVEVEVEAEELDREWERVRRLEEGSGRWTLVLEEPRHKLPIKGEGDRASPVPEPIADESRRIS